MNEEKNQKVLAVVLVIAVLGLGIYKIFFSNDKKSNKIDTETISIVKDFNEFYTVSNCVEIYFTYLSADDKNNILVLLSNEYKKENEVNSGNLYNYIKKFDRDYSFTAKKMYVQQKSSKVYKYYVYGKKISGDEYAAGKDVVTSDYYLIVLLDKSNTTFAIEPYDGEIFNK